MDMIPKNATFCECKPLRHVGTLPPLIETSIDVSLLRQAGSMSLIAIDNQMNVMGD